MRLVDHPDEIAAADWNALVASTCGHAHPMIQHAFFSALRTSGSTGPGTGWNDAHVTLWQNNALVALAPTYLKEHSWGEYVFDWAWASAYEDHGLRYYPKAVCAIPFTPVAAPKLLARSEDARRALAAVLPHLPDVLGASSLHVLFPAADEIEVLRQAGGLLRQGVQFHWRNPSVSTFEEWLECLVSHKRKKIRADRKRVREAGVLLRCLTGNSITSADWDYFYHCYTQTYLAHHSTPYLTRDFFSRLAQAQGDQCLLVLAERNGHPVATSLSFFDGQTLYGRYWGCSEPIACLHFEACYYTPIEFCIAQRIRVFEGGAQGEHKLARGFAPVTTHSAHWLSHPEFSKAVERFLAREAAGVDRYLDELSERTPFRADNTGRH